MNNKRTTSYTYYNINMLSEWHQNQTNNNQQRQTQIKHQHNKQQPYEW